MIRGIVLGAGMGRRMGGPKALARLEGQTFHARAVTTLQSGGLEVISVVNAAVARALPPPGMGEARVVNPDPDQADGMFSSVRLGVVEALAQGSEGALLLPVDYPFITAEDVRSVVAGLRAGALIVVPVHEGRRGHPIGIARAAMAEILSARPGATLRDVVRRDRERVVEVPGSMGILQGINTKEELKQASNRAFR